MEVRILSPLTIGMLLGSLVVLYFLIRYLFNNSVLFKIGISTGTVIILVSFISGVQAKLGPVHNLWAFPLQIALAVMAYVYISVTIKKPLISIIQFITEISEGNINVTIDDQVGQKQDEIGQIARAMSRLQNGLKGKAVFSRNIGDGHFDDSFEKLSEHDELGEALLNMQNSLQNARENDLIRKAEDERRNWVTMGQAKFAEILRQNVTDVADLSYRIISNIVPYMGINQGGLFLLNDEDKKDPFLELTACYAFDRRKFIQKRIEPGEGLVGTCFLEGEYIYLKEIPQDYIRITSGLGDHNPTDLLIVPLKINEDVYGVMELASFHSIEKHQIEFAEKIGEIIASAISGLRINNRTTMLLEKSQQQAEEMRAQEEEMRQNMEELNATQEAMAEKDKENVETIKILRQEINLLKQQLTDTIGKNSSQPK